jgi:lysophospholipase L1-like esterase
MVDAKVREVAASRPARPMPKISLRHKLLFIAVILGVLGFSQELVFRLAFPFPEVMNFNRNNYVRVFLSDRRAEEARRDGSRNTILRVESAPDGYKFDHTLNLYGFRGPTFPVTPPTDRPRVIFVGDSFVEGMGASDSDTVSAHFARRLGPGQPVEAINLGVSGTGFVEYTRLVRDGVSLLRPAVAYVVVYANDLPAPVYPDELNAPAPTAVWNNPWVPRVIQAFRRIKQGLAVPRFFHSGPFPYFDAVPSENNPLTAAKAPEGADPEIVNAMRQGRANPVRSVEVELLESRLRHDFQAEGTPLPYVARMAELCRVAGTRLVLVYLPCAATVNPSYLKAQKRLGTKAYGGVDSLDDPRYRSQQRELRRVADVLSVPLLDLTDHYRAAEQSGRRMYWTIDGHCNSEGYRLAADVCARSFTEGLLPLLQTQARREANVPKKSRLRTRQNP